MRKTLRKLAVLLVASALALVLSEVWLRHRLPLDGLIFQPDDELLFTTLPGARNVLVMDERNGGDWVPIEIGPEGYRGPGLREGGSGRRIAVYGDSLVLSENVRFEDSFPERLGFHLRQRFGEEFEVVNAGVTGYCPGQALLKMEREYEGLRPEAIVFVLCATNDFGDLVRNQLFGLDEHGALLRHHPVLGPAMRAEFERRQARAGELALWRALRAARASLVRPAPEETSYPYLVRYLAGTQEEFRQAVRQRTGVVQSLFFDYYDADVAIHPDWPSSQYKVRLMGAVLARIAEACRERSVHLSFVVVPSAVDLDPEFAIRVDTELHPGYDPRRLASTMARLGSETGAPTVDLTGAIESSGEPGRWFEGHEDFHWNREGQDLSAEVLAGEAWWAEVVGG